jgi:hypothetical protein
VSTYTPTESTLTHPRVHLEEETNTAGTVESQDKRSGRCLVIVRREMDRVCTRSSTARQAVRQSDPREPVTFPTARRSRRIGQLTRGGQRGCTYGASQVGGCHAENMCSTHDADGGEQGCCCAILDTVRYGSVGRGTRPKAMVKTRVAASPTTVGQNRGVCRISSLCDPCGHGRVTPLPGQGGCIVCPRIANRNRHVRRASHNVEPTNAKDLLTACLSG